MLSPYQLQLLGLYLEISVFVPVLVPGSSDGSALLAGPGPGLVVVSKALHCAARPGPGCHHDHASTLLILLKEWMLYMYIALISTRSSSFYSEHVSKYVNNKG